ncbi:MAG: DUF4974 domain-containing protein [Muribaculaceae bacterium]|nr:DUF4974 domain-containing protein [Muribaculaceae bacterium]
MDNKDIDFIARRYRKGRFDADTGWSGLGLTPPPSRWKRYRVAAAVAATVVLSATAALIYHTYRAVEMPHHTVQTPAINSLVEVKVIDFENASLAEVVKRIEEVYNVKVGNLPENDKDYRLSLHFEGTPTDLIDLINDILDTQMTVTER